MINNLKKAAYPISITTIGAALLGVNPYINKLMPTHGDIQTIVLILSVLVTIFGISLWVIYELRSYANNNKICGTTYLVRRISEDEIVLLDHMAAEYFGDVRASIETVREWHRQHPEGLSVIEKIRKNGKKVTKIIVGGICILPINQRACELMEKGLLNGINILPEHLGINKRQTSGAYVAAIFAEGLVAKSVAIGYTTAILDKYFTNNKVVYTRPVTQDGLRICRSHGFSPVDKHQKDVVMDLLCKKTKW